MRLPGWPDYSLRPGKDKAKSTKSIRRSSINRRKIRYSNSAPRNLFIPKHLDNLRYVEGLGCGIPMILRDMGEGAHFEEIGELFVLKLEYS